MALINIFIVSDYDWLGGGRPHDLLMENPPSIQHPPLRAPHKRVPISDDQWRRAVHWARNPKASPLLRFPANGRYGITWALAKRYSMGKYIHLIYELKPNDNSNPLAQQCLTHLIRQVKRRQFGFEFFRACHLTFGFLVNLFACFQRAINNSVWPQYQLLNFLSKF